MYSDFDRERFLSETHKSSARSDFERDLARIIHSSALKRLGAKTQVIAAGNNDFVRTRLTHTLEVAQIGRQMAINLNLESDIIEAACLAHDLGHPPFGHLGESVLNEIAQDIGGFEGNAQTFRLLTRLEPKFMSDSQHSVGLNLTRASLDACIKYPWGFENAVDHKFNFYSDDAEIYNWVKQGKSEKCIEAQVMDLADDISYCVHDFEDGYSEKLINFELLNDKDQILPRLLESPENQLSEDSLSAAYDSLQSGGYFATHFDGSFASYSQLKSVTSSLIGRFLVSAQNATQEKYADADLSRYNSNLVIPQNTANEIALLKTIESVYFINADEVVSERTKQARIIQELVKYFMASNPRPAEQMMPHFLLFWDQAQSDSDRLRVAIDQVASLTDQSAQTLSFLKH